MHRTAEELSTLEGADAHGFGLAGSGSGTVVTPPFYRSGAKCQVTLRGDRIVTETKTAIVDRSGRLRIEVPLGPANRYQDDTAQAMAAGTAVHTTRVATRVGRAEPSAAPGLEVG